MKCVNCRRQLQKYEIIKDDFNNDCCGYCGSLIKESTKCKLCQTIIPDNKQFCSIEHRAQYRFVPKDERKCSLCGFSELQCNCQDNLDE